MTNKNNPLITMGMISAIAFPVGLIVVALGLIIITGDPITAGTLVFYSIVCTLGISLLIWIPLIWLVGFLAASILVGASQIFGISLDRLTVLFPELKQPVGAVFQAAVSRPTVKHQSLVNYIRQAQAKGFSTSQIHNRLRQEGWNQTEIEQAQAAIDVTV